MARPRSSKQRPPLDRQRLEEVALRYVGKYATTRSKLTSYLARKVGERGWGEAGEPDLEGLAQRFSELGYVDDAAYALAKSRALSSRGYGKRRLSQKLRVAGVGEEDASAAREHAEAEALASALRFAKRRGIGPYASEIADGSRREKAVAAMVRAGHEPALAWAIARLAPGEEPDSNLNQAEGPFTHN